MKPRTISLLFALATLGIVFAQENAKDFSAPAHGMNIHRPDQITWKAGPPSLPPGAKMAVLEGDPAQEGLFTMRVIMPDDFSIQPHTHPAVEHVTVISGTLNIGMGDTFDKAATTPMPTGTFGHWPAGMKHFGWTKGETILQVHGVGPWKINYLNPADDPRNKK